MIPNNVLPKQKSFVKCIYTIFDNHVVFSSDFNDSIDPYIEVISKYKGLVFANRDCVDAVFTLSGGYIDKSDMGSCPIPTNSEFNQPINYLPNNLKRIAFGNSFDQHVVLPDGLEEFSMGSKFNQPIALPNTLKKLVIGESFSQEIDLPMGLRELTLKNNHKVIDYLPHSLKTLNLGTRFNMEMNNLPTDLSYIYFDSFSDYNKSLYNLPSSVKSLNLPRYYRNSLRNLPSSVEFLEVSENYRGEINPGIKYVMRKEY